MISDAIVSKTGVLTILYINQNSLQPTNVKKRVNVGVGFLFKETRTVTKIIRIDGTVVKAIILSKSALDPNL